MGPQLHRDGVLARPLAPGDLEALFAAIEESRQEVGRWMGWCHPGFSKADAAHWIEHCGAEWACGRDREFGLFDAASGELLGCAGVNQVNAVHNFANVGYWVRTSRAGAGIATTAVRALAGFAFGELGLARLEIVARVGNVASLRVAEKAGARLEALARRRIGFRGEACDALLYSLLPADLDAAGEDGAVRPFRPSDYDAARALWEREPGVGLSAADEREPVYRYLARNPGMSFVAVEGALVGTVLCGHDGRRGLIHHLATAPSHRRRGFGSALLRRALQALRREGIDKCHLMVLRSNADGMAFWRRVGAEERVSLALFSLPSGP